MLKTPTTNIEQFLSGLIYTMGFIGAVRSEQTDDSLIFNIDVDYPGILIGRDGEGLLALQHLVRIIAGKKGVDPEVFIIIDVNGYRQKKQIYLQKIVDEAVAKVQSTGKPVTLAPMSSFDRLTIHRMVGKISGLESGSEGEGEERRVVVNKTGQR